MRKIRKGDQVIVLTGKDNGKKGTVVSMVSDHFVIVEGVNISKKHQKPESVICFFLFVVCAFFVKFATCVVQCCGVVASASLEGRRSILYVPLG